MIFLIDGHRLQKIVRYTGLRHCTVFIFTMWIWDCNHQDYQKVVPRRKAQAYKAPAQIILGKEQRQELLDVFYSLLLCFCLLLIALLIMSFSSFSSISVAPQHLLTQQLLSKEPLYDTWQLSLTVVPGSWNLLGTVHKLSIAIQYSSASLELSSV